MCLVEPIFLFIPGKWCEVHELPQLAAVKYLKFGLEYFQ